MNSIVAAAGEALDRIEEVGRPEIWISLRSREDVLGQAQQTGEALEAGETLPLAGLTFAVKDNIDVAGMPTTAGHPEFSYVPEKSAPVVERLTAAGALLIGKTNMDQLATGLVGTRSPYGEVASALDESRVSGGSSSGSGAAVGRALVDFSLGTDTAGSGRVPAAFNGIVGIKPTLGLLPSAGVVPACPSYDTVSVFAPDVARAATVLSIAVGPQEGHPHSRTVPPTAPLGAPTAPVVAVPRREDLGMLSAEALQAFGAAVRRMEDLGSQINEISIEPFLEAARLLYDGGLVAERAYSFGDFIAEHPEQADPSVSAIARNAQRVLGTEVIRDQQRLLELTVQARQLMQGAAALLLPTVPEHPTVEEVREAPLEVNARLGVFTNFVNLMDMAAVAVPYGETPGQGLFGVSVIVPAFHDQVALDLAAAFMGEPGPAPLLLSSGMDLAVFGAHMRGEALNSQLVGLGARYMCDISTAPSFRMHLIEGEVPRPGVVQADDGGASIPGELWRVPETGVTALLQALPAPMALGPVTLDDGSVVTGFTAGLTGAEPDITRLGGWRGYLAQAA